MVSKNRCSFQALLENKAAPGIFKELDEMNGILEKHGVRLEFSPSRQQGRKGAIRYSVILITDYEAVRRGAGRKRKQSAISIGDALRMENDGFCKVEIAAMMGISLATYYRRRREYLSSIQHCDV